MDRKKKIQQLSALADSAADIQLIEKIELQRRAILRGRPSTPSHSTHSPSTHSHSKAPEEEVFNLHLNGFTFRLDMQTAAASIDTLIDLWVEEVHMRLPGFSGRENGTVLDIGANEGFYSLRIQQQNRAAKVLAIEPVRATYKRLAENIELNSCSTVYTLQAAVDSAAGRINLQCHSAVPTIASKNVGQLNQSWINKEHLAEEIAEAYSLDALVSRYREYGFDGIDLIKIDVEGAELDVLKGAVETLEKTARIVVEWHSPELRDGVIAFLTQSNFRLLHAERQRFGDLYFQCNKQAQ